MSGLEIHPFAEEHLDGAASLLEKRHRRHRGAEPLLGESYDFRAEIDALWRGEGASGAVATRDGRVVGYLLGIRNDDARWGPNVWVEPAGYAVEEVEDIRDLYAAAAARWMGEGRMRQYVMAPTADAAAVDACFGLQHAHGIREVPDVPWPAGVRLAAEGDIDALVGLSSLIVEHQARAPVFGISLPRESAEEIRAEIIGDLVNPDLGDLVAEQNGRIVGAFQLAPVELSNMHAGLARPEGAVLLSWAATKPEVRGSGAGVALTEASFAWAREHGYKTMVTDWRETNLLSSRFWPRRGFRRSFVRLYRSIP
jgi:GNAT superfamily N-acetyltransferase